MGRWEPNARGRLARAALTLSAERGYENVTVTEIAAAAGVTERTFYRHFPDKADALFPDNAGLLTLLSDTVTQALGRGDPPREATLAAVRLLASLVAEEPERALLGRRVIPAVPTLAGRDLVRQAQAADAIAAALTTHRVPHLQARLAAETALAVWRTALADWVTGPDDRDLTEVVTAVAHAAESL